MNKGKVGIIMGAGKGTRLAPITWQMTKAVVHAVGAPMLHRINEDLLAKQGYKTQLISTWYRQQQILDYVKTYNSAHGKSKLETCSLGTGEKDLIGNAGGAYLAYMNKFAPGQSIRSVLHFDARNLKELSRQWIKEVLDPEHNKIDQDVFWDAVKDIIKLKPLNDERFPVFSVVGCDCLAHINLNASRALFLEHRESGLLGNLTLSPNRSQKDIQNYGLVVVAEHLVDKFIEKPVKLRGKYDSEAEYFEWVDKLKNNVYDDQGQFQRVWLVNQQVYDFDPAVLAIIETHLEVANEMHIKHNGFPDMSNHVNKLLAAAKKLCYRVINETKEHWSDVGDIMTFQEAMTVDIMGKPKMFEINPKTLTVLDDKDKKLCGLVYTGDEGNISSGAQLKGNIYVNGSVDSKSILENAVIELGAQVEGSTIQNSVLLPGAKVKPGWTINNSVLGYGLELGDPSKYGISEINGLALVPGWGYYQVIAARIKGTKPGEDRNQMVDCPQTLGHK